MCITHGNDGINAAVQELYYWHYMDSKPQIPLAHPGLDMVTGADCGRSRQCSLKLNTLC